MKIARKLTSDGDYSFGNNQENFIVGIDSIAQMIRTKLLLFRGEWWSDLLDGVPIIQEVLNSYNIDVASTAAASMCSRRILEVDGVTKVDDVTVSVNRDTREISVSVKVDTVYGTVQQEVEIT